MLDADVVAASLGSVYRVLKSAGHIDQQGRRASSKGQGFDQPSRLYEHWYIAIAYLNICGTFYYLCTILNGHSAGFVNEYNNSRLHCGIGYVAPLARLEGRDQQIMIARLLALAAARQARGSPIGNPANCHPIC